jgi:alanine dehydrogenase
MVANFGVEKTVMKDSLFRGGVNIYKGKLVYEQVAKDLDLPFTPLEL